MWTYLNMDDMKLHLIGEDDFDQREVGWIIMKLALVSEKPLKTLHKAQKSDDKLAGVLDIVRLVPTSCCERSRRKLFAFWRDVVKVHVGGSQ